MTIFPSPERLARFSTRRPWLVVAAWTILLVAALAAATQVGSVLTSSAKNYVSTESKTASDLLEERLYGGDQPVTETVVVQSETMTAGAPAFRALLANLSADLRALNEDVTSVTSIVDAPGPPLTSRDGRTTLMPVTLAGAESDSESHAAAIINVLEKYDGKDGFSVVTGGFGSASHAFTEGSKKDLETSEIFGIPMALIILVIVFGALVAAGLPLLLGIVAIVVAIGMTTVLGQAFELSTFVVNFVTTMGLAVGIDYTLVIVQRYREERVHGLTRDEAIIKAGATASRAVLFSGMAVIVALFGMILVPNSIFVSLGVGAIFVVAAAVAAALTLLPAILRLLGDHVNAVRIRIPGLSRRRAAGGPTFWDRTTRIVMRHPVASVVLSVGLLVLAALPYATIKLGWAGVSTLPDDSDAKRAFTILNAEFSAGVIAPVQVVVDRADNPASLAAETDRIVGRLRQDPNFGPATITVNEAGDLALISAPLAGEPQGDAARTAVTRLRESFATGDRIYVSGATAEGIDDSNVIADYTIPVFLFVLGLSFIILLVVFRSIVVPVKALIMNLLSVGAAYGLMVLIFQHGVGNELVGFQQVERIESWVPLFMFAVLFGLSMDYHVFLLTRIRERYEHTGNNAESVAYGVRSTAGMITGAAAIMIAVFAGFAAGEMAAFQQMGFGLAVAVLLDATIVRIVLVPASMALLGDRNWYLPSWLRWLPKVDVEGSSEMPPAAHRGIPAAPADALPGR